MKLGVGVDRKSGVPRAARTDAARVPETLLGPAVLADIPAAVEVPPETPVRADRGSDSDLLREDLAAAGFWRIAPPRVNRTKPSRNDGRVMRWSKRRFVVERAFVWVQSFRRVATRYEYLVDLSDGFVALACAFIALSKL